MKLTEVLTIDDLSKLQRFFPFSLVDLEVVLEDRDGPGGMGGRVKPSILKPSKVLYLDKMDMKFSGQYLDMSDLVTREIVAHETTHVEQNMRGFFYRLKMWFWRTFITYEERPHEKEAYLKAQSIRAAWNI